MKRLAFLISLSITFVPYDVMALSARTVSIEDAQGISGKIITLEVAPGYGLNINLIPTGEIVKKAWIDDPSRITLSFDGNLCQGATQQCNNEGATVIHLRQIKPIQFPDLPRSAGGGTLLTLITEGNQGRKIYQFKVMPISGTPKYTVLNVSSENPANTPLLPRSNAPLMVNNSQRRQSLTNFQQQQFQRAKQRRLAPIEQTSTEPSVESTIGKPTAAGQSEIVQPASTFKTSPSTDNATTQIATSNATPQSSESNPEQASISANSKVSPLPDNPKPQSTSVAIPKTSPRSSSNTSTPTVSKPKKTLQSSNVTAIKPQSLTSTQQANALIRGLVIARQKGQINNKTKAWKQVQSVVLLLRRGATKQEAVKKVGVSLQLVEQLIVWGSSPTSTFTSFNKIPAN